MEKCKNKIEIVRSVNGMTGDVIIKGGSEGDIPTKLSQLENDVPYVTQGRFDSVLDGVKEDIRENTSQIRIDHDDIKVLEGRVDDIDLLMDEKQDKLTAGTGVEITEDNTINVTLDAEIFVVVDRLPATGTPNKIYLVPKQTTETGNVYEEYIWIDTNKYWEKVGEEKIDLSNYYNKTEIDSKINTINNKDNAQDSIIINHTSNITTLQNDVQNINNLLHPYYEDSIIPRESLEVPDNWDVSGATRTYDTDTLSYDFSGKLRINLPHTGDYTITYGIELAKYYGLYVNGTFYNLGRPGTTTVELKNVSYIEFSGLDHLCFYEVIIMEKGLTLETTNVNYSGVVEEYKNKNVTEVLNIVNDRLNYCYSEDSALHDYINDLEFNKADRSEIPDVSEFITSETDPIFKASPAYGITSADIARWNNSGPAAEETDPIFKASPAYGITSANISTWNNITNNYVTMTVNFTDGTSANYNILKNN